jgi:WhiB family redox-sensing transcriptional regulator
METGSSGVPKGSYEYDWREAAACRQTSPELFFPERGGPVKRAKQFCVNCLVRVRCLDEALSWPVGEDHGVWGGMTQEERTRERARRRRLSANQGDEAVS